MHTRIYQNVLASANKCHLYPNTCLIIPKCEWLCSCIFICTYNVNSCMSTWTYMYVFKSKWLDVNICMCPLHSNYKNINLDRSDVFFDSNAKHFEIELLLYGKSYLIFTTSMTLSASGFWNGNSIRVEQKESQSLSSSSSSDPSENIKEPLPSFC